MFCEVDFERVPWIWSIVCHQYFPTSENYKYSTGSPNIPTGPARFLHNQLLQVRKVPSPILPHIRTTCRSPSLLQEQPLILMATFDLIRSITDDFSEKQLIGQGGFGAVYKGVLPDGQVIAVRKLHNLQGIDDEQFQKEFSILVKVQHKNIVPLLAYCYVKNYVPLPYNGRYILALKTERAMCYEYMRNGSLNHYISDIRSGLDWPERFRIIKEICQGLLYLHQSLESPIFHMNLKPSNILLDQNMSPKISDFGLARLVGEENIKRMGRIEYMSPEFIEKQVISNKCDIFSLGIIITKLITGERFYSQHFDISNKKFIELALESWRDRLQMARNSMSVERDCQQVRTCIEMALKCVDHDRRERPSIGEIIHMLSKTETLIPEEVRAVQKRSKPLLLDVHPLELHFPFMLKGRKKGTISCSLHLNNWGDDRVAFMLVANIPKRYLKGKSPCGVVPPRSFNTLILTKIKQTPPTSSDNSDFFTLYSATAGQYDLLDAEKDYTQYDNFFKKSMEYGDVQVARLKVVCDRPAAKSAGTSPEDRCRIPNELATMDVASKIRLGADEHSRKIS